MNHEFYLLAEIDVDEPEVILDYDDLEPYFSYESIKKDVDHLNKRAKKQDFDTRYVIYKAIRVD